MNTKLKVTLKRSTISCTEGMRATVRALGLSRINSSVIVDSVPQKRGMIKKIIHLVKVEEV